jgi:hypothetical protein
MRFLRLVGFLIGIITVSFLLNGCGGSSSNDTPASDTVTVPLGVMNASKNVVVGSTYDSDYAYFSVFVQKADSYQESDIEGTWYIKDLWVSTHDHDVTLDQSSTTDLIADYGASIDADGIVSIPIPDASVHAVMGASKDIIVVVSDDEDDSGVSITVLVKAGTDCDYTTDLVSDRDDYGWYEDGIWVTNPLSAFGVTNEKGLMSFETPDVFTGTWECPISGDSWDVDTATATLGAATGIITITGQNAEGDDFTGNGILSEGTNVFITADDSDDLGLSVVVKRASSYATANLEGTWYYRGIEISLNDSPYSAGIDYGTFTFESDGSFTGSGFDNDGFTWSESGTAGIDDDGLVQATLDSGIVLE